MVSNLLTRRIRKAWEERSDEFRGSGINEPRQLAIAVKETHKLLYREMESQTTFNTIPREISK